jgi:hypothetical protein
MLHPHVLVQSAQYAADHATRLKHMLGRVALAGTLNRRAVELEGSAYRMELEAKASLLCRWQGRCLPPPSHRITEPAMSNVPYLDARAVTDAFARCSKGGC